MGGLFKICLGKILAANNMLFCAFNVQMQTVLWSTRPIPIQLQLSTTTVNAATQSQSLPLSGKMPSQVSKVLGFVKLSPNAFIPTKGSDKAAGFDLKSAYNYVIAPRSKEMVKTDLQIKLPEGCYGRIAPRSGLTWKNGIDVGAGVVDEDYRGDIRVILFNHSDEPFTIQAGDRIAQLICEQILYPEIQEFKELDETSRGIGGFGSTGKN